MAEINFTRKFKEQTGCTVKYPKQIFSAIKKKGNMKTTFAVEAHLVAVDDDNGITPGELHKAGLSRFVLSLLKVDDASKNAVTGNIPVSEIASFLHEAHFSLNYLSQLKVTGTNNASVSSGTGVTLKFGTFKGKTPEEVLQENPNNKDALENTKKLLMEKVAQYPANQELIDAIDAAINNLSSGVKAPIVSGPKTFSVYSSGIKVPNSSKVNANGKTLVYTIDVECNPNMKIPYDVKIMNGYCLVPKDGEVDFKSMEDNSTINTRLTKEQFCTLIANIERRLNMFEMLNAEKAAFLEDKYSYFHEDLSKDYEIPDEFFEKLATIIADKLK